MHRMILAATVVMCTSWPLSAEAGYAFHIRATDGRSGLLSNPDYQKLKMSPAQLEKAASDRVIVLSDAQGTRWRWLMLSWFDENPKVEQALNERGSAPARNADIAISAGGKGHFRVRCLRDDCQVRVRRLQESESRAQLKRGEQSRDIPLESTLTLDFEPARVK